MPAITAFNHYERIRHRLPTPAFTDHIPTVCNSILDIAEHFDLFLFDAFGVLNVGSQAIPHAVEHIAALRNMGKQVMIVSNAASNAKSYVVEKFHRMGFDFADTEITTSRDAVLAGLTAFPRTMRWGLVSPETGQEDLSVVGINVITQDHPDFYNADVFLFLSTARWDDERHAILLEALNHKPRPILLGNPDLIAPMIDYTSYEPGSYILLLEDHLFQHAQVFGKPFANIYRCAQHAVQQRNLPFNPERTLMLGDTLHTDILGGHAYGIRTALVSDYGFFRGLDYRTYIEQSGIIPDYILPKI